MWLDDKRLLILIMNIADKKIDEKTINHERTKELPIPQ